MYAAYEALPLKAKQNIVQFVEGLLSRYTDEVPGEVLLLHCVFRGWDERIASAVIRMECELHNLKLV